MIFVTDARGHSVRDMAHCQKLLEVLKAELAFLDEEGYRARPRYPWRPNFVFQDSPTCLNFNNFEEHGPTWGAL